MSSVSKVSDALRQAGRFGLVGIAATLTHLGVAQIVFRMSGEPLLANGVGFAVAFFVGLLGHYHFTFPGQKSPLRAFCRYGVIAVIGFLANNVVLIGLVAWGWVGEAFALSVAILVVPAGTYLASRFWGFSTTPPKPISRP